MVGASGEQVTTEKLRADLGVLVADMEQFLEATANQTGEHIAQVRSNPVESLHSAKARLASLQDAALDKARAAGRETDRYVHANPWPVIGDRRLRRCGGRAGDDACARRKPRVLASTPAPPAPEVAAESAGRLHHMRSRGTDRPLREK
jgi:ElaB/YqjD/DUF883 family membrane-anchored ribosome-binding protein